MKKITDYAELVKAKHALNKTIAPVEDGANMAGSYTTGQQFIRDGVLYTALTSIAASTAFSSLTLDTDYEVADDITSQLSSVNSALTQTNAELSHRNLLDNPWFTVNQRGFTSGSATLNTYIADRWVIKNATSGTVTINADGTITLNNSADSSNELGVWNVKEVEQVLQGGKTYTMSCMLADGSVFSDSFICPTLTSSWATIKTAQSTNGRIVIIANNQRAVFQIVAGASKTISIKAVKLELGTVSTLAQDTAPNYQQELAKCQRYFKRIVIGERIGRINNSGLTIRFGLDEVENMRDDLTATEVVDAQTGVYISGAGAQLWLAKTTDYTVSADKIGGIILNLTETGAAKLASYTNQIVGIWNYNQYLDLSADL